MSGPGKAAQIKLIIVCLCVSVLVALACQADEKSYAVGVISNTPLLDDAINGFKSGMTDLGYVEGKNVTYLYAGPTDPQHTAAEVQRLLDHDLDLILALGTPVALAVKRAVSGTNIPVVFVPVYDPVRSNLVQDLVKPGGNLTGIRTGGLIAKLLEIHMTIDPSISRVFVPHNPADDASVQSLAELEFEATILGIDLIITEVSTDAELSAALGNIPADADSLFLLTSGSLLRQVDEFVDAAFKHGIPLSSSGRGGSSGLLFGYETDRNQYGRQVSRLANKILLGSSPSDLPVERAESLLSINLRTGKAIGIEIPDEILMIAEVVVR